MLTRLHRRRQAARRRHAKRAIPTRQTPDGR
jgi:hypothetical protein